MTQQAPAWSKDNSILLSEFLDGGTGQKFLAQLAMARPTLASDSSDVNTVALRAQLVAGYEKALYEIQRLMTPPELPTATEEDQWADLDRPEKPKE